MRLSLTLFLLILTWCGPPASAQTPLSERWLQGVAVLTDGDTLLGSVNINTENEALRVNLGERVRTFSTQNVRAFHLYDEELGQTRRFRTLEYGGQTDYERPTFFEVLEEGRPLQLYGRERTVIVSVPTYDPFVNRTYSTQRPQLKREFFFRRDDGRIQPFLGRKRDLYLLLSDRKREIRRFLKRNRLRYDEARDLVEIVKYYNQLENPG